MSAPKIIAGLVLAGGVAAGLVYRFGYAHNGSAENGQIRISGNIEAIEAQVGFKIAGHVDRRPVDEGYTVHEGQLIAQLETADLQCDVAARAGELAVAKAQLAALEAGSRPEEIAAADAAMKKAAAMLAELLAGSRPQEIAVAQATLASATAEKIRWEKEFARAAHLHELHTISSEEFDQTRAAFDVAVAKVREATERLDLAKEGPRHEEIDQARAALAQAKAQYDLVKAGPRKEDIDQGRARVRQAEANLRLAETRLGYATLPSPMPGVVLSKNIEPGEYVSPGTPVVTVANLKDIWLRGYISETDLGRVKLQQKARVTTDGLPGKVFDGYVSFISDTAEFTPKTVQTPQERVKLVFRVKINIQNPQMVLKPGMPADAEIVTED